MFSAIVAIPTIHKALLAMHWKKRPTKSHITAYSVSLIRDGAIKDQRKMKNHICVQLVVSDRQAILIKASTRIVNNSVFLLETASAIDPMNGLETTDTKAPSVRKIDVYLWVRDGAKPIRFSSTVGSKGIMKAKSSSSGVQSKIARVRRFPTCKISYLLHKPCHLPVNNARLIVLMIQVSDDLQEWPHGTPLCL